MQPLVRAAGQLPNQASQLGIKRTRLLIQRLGPKIRGRAWGLGEQPTAQCHRIHPLLQPGEHISAGQSPGSDAEGQGSQRAS